MNHFIQDERGATSVEYALIALLIFLVIVVSVTALGGTVKGLFESILPGFKTT